MLIRNLLSLFSTNNGLTERQEAMLAPVETAKASRSEKYESDIRAITDKYGELTPGLCIETTLQDLLSIVPRHRPRIDAYNGLVTELRTKHGVKLSILSRKTKNKMKKIVIIDQFVFDANVNTKQQIEDLVQAQFNIMTKPGTLQFSYDKTAKGYKYVIKRYLPYAYNGFILDNDCTYLTDIPIYDFQVDPLNRNHKRLLYAIPGKYTDGYYIPVKIFEGFYKEMLSAATNAEIPTKVKVFAHDTMVGVDVDY